MSETRTEADSNFEVTSSALAARLASRRVLICCGSGGVGKTTVAAALALGAAHAGRRVCVVTIDPARRLADALGAGEITNSPHRIDGPWSGELSAVMLDAKGTFDDLVARYARDSEQTTRILDNRLYRNLVSALSGTQEYMATEKLFELDASGKFDLVVVDTPPTHHALDFLDAPSRLTGFLDNRVFRVLLTPGRSYMKAMNAASQVLLRTIGKVAGSEIVEDTIAFFQAFEGMEDGFRERAARVEQLLAAEGTGFVVVASPRRDSIEEAEFFTGKLREGRHVVDALVVNRVHPDFGPPLIEDLDNPVASLDSPWSVLNTNLAEMAAVVLREQTHLAALTTAVAPATVVLVPLLEEDVHDLASLEGVVRHLVGGTLPLAGGQDRDRQ